MFKVARFWRITRTLGFYFAGTINFLIKSFWIRATDSHGCQRKKNHIFSRCDRNTRGRFGVDCPRFKIHKFVSSFITHTDFMTIL